MGSGKVPVASLMRVLCDAASAELRPSTGISASHFIFQTPSCSPCCRLEVRAVEEAEFREAFSGPLTSSKVTGLLPGTNYLFRRALPWHGFVSRRDEPTRALLPV